MTMSDLEYNKYLPPYRSLLNPNVSYDYRTHRAVQLTQSDLKNILAKCQSMQSQAVKHPFQKYRSLLSDVSLKASMLTRKVSALKTAHTAAASFFSLPVEVQVTILHYVDDAAAFRNCLYVCKHFYQLSKPFVYRAPSFTSTYRFAQFVTLLRLNPAVGSYVLEIDLSALKPGNDDAAADDDYYAADDSPAHADEHMVALASWRDWKFKNNFRVLHPVAVPLARPAPGAPPAHAQSKRIKISKYLKLRKAPPVGNGPHRTETYHHARKSPPSGHPLTNRFLANYAASKDIPIGAVLHLIRLCPNLQALDLSNISLSSDYKVTAPSFKYALYDTAHNYPKDMLSVVESIAPQPSGARSFSVKTSIFDLASSASSVFSLSTFSKPIAKYNSLLPPATHPGYHAKRGEGVMFLSDLNLKSISTASMEFVSQEEILVQLQRSDTLSRLNMSSVIWLNAKLIRSFLREFFAAEITQRCIDGRELAIYRGKVFEAGDIVPDIRSERVPGDGRRLLLDLRNSGMNKNLPWAQTIDTHSLRGEKLIFQILNDELMSTFEEFVLNERRRRGRVGENYFS